MTVNLFTFMGTYSKVLITAEHLLARGGMRFRRPSPSSPARRRRCQPLSG